MRAFLLAHRKNTGRNAHITLKIQAGMPVSRQARSRGTTPFGPDALVYKVGGKMFALTAPTRSATQLQDASASTEIYLLRSHRFASHRDCYENLGLDLPRRRVRASQSDGSSPGNSPQGTRQAQRARDVAGCREFLRGKVVAGLGCGFGVRSCPRHRGLGQAERVEGVRRTRRACGFRAAG